MRTQIGTLGVEDFDNDACIGPREKGLIRRAGEDRAMHRRIAEQCLPLAKRRNYLRCFTCD